MEDMNILETVEIGAGSGRGNLLGIQPWMRQVDYASEEAFFSRLDGYFRAAREKGWIAKNTIAVLPEYLGTWLVVASEKRPVLQATTITAAMSHLVRSHPVAFALELLRAREKQRVEASLFRLKAQEMARIYTAVFSRLAREYGVTIAAGSILLPEPRVVNGQVLAGKGPLYNICAVFRPDGRAEPELVKKAYPIASEQPFVSQGTPGEIPAFDTPAGRLGILICADSWFPEAFERMRALEVEILAVPSAVLPGDHWMQPWMGYSGFTAPEDVDPTDIGRLLEFQAWDRYALEGRFARSGARLGMNLFLYGVLWDLSPCAGRWKMIAGEAVTKGCCDGAALINVSF